MNKFRTYADVSKLVTENIHKIPWDIDLIVGIPRSGIIPSMMISLLLNKPVCDVETYLNKNTWNGGIRARKNNFKYEDVKKVLIVDDTVNTCLALNEVKDKIKKLGEKNHEILYVCVFVTPGKESEVDIYFEKLSYPRFFEWNFIHHPELQYACLDIDGVVCEDPTEDQNDDGEKYIEFLKTAKPLYVPTVPVSCFVTSRLEKYRKYTEEWLAKYNIQYKELLMLDLPSKEERIRLKAHGKFKASVYKNRNERLFIESNWEQAKEIAKIAQKPVVCTDNLYFISDPEFLNIQDIDVDAKRSRLSNDKDNEIYNLRKELEYIKKPMLWKLVNKIVNQIKKVNLKGIKVFFFFLIKGKKLAFKNAVLNDQVTNVKYKSNKVMFSSNGNDPFFVFSNFNLQRGIKMIKMKLFVTQDTTFQVFYKTQKDAGFSERKSIKKKLNQGQNKIIIELIEDEINDFRIDPGCYKGDYIISNLCLGYLSKE